MTIKQLKKCLEALDENMTINVFDLKTGDYCEVDNVSLWYYGNVYGEDVPLVYLSYIVEIKD